MKKIILYTLLLAFPVAVFCQSIPNDMPAIKTDYLKKSNNQKTAAWLLLSGGFALTVTSALIAAPKVTEDYGNALVGIFSAEPVPQKQLYGRKHSFGDGHSIDACFHPFLYCFKKK